MQGKTRTGSWNASNVRPALESWHQKNLDEGFSCHYVFIAKSTKEEIVRIQNMIKEVDEIANQTDNKGRRISNQKPYFRYTMIQPDGSEKPIGGGWYLYTGFRDTDDPRFHKNTKQELKGIEPLYLRGKSAVQHNKLPNFSVQWNKVGRFYWKPHTVKEDTLEFTEGNKTVRLIGISKLNL